jgi:hypothetical protein
MAEYAPCYRRVAARNRADVIEAVAAEEAAEGYDFCSSTTVFASQ